MSQRHAFFNYSSYSALVFSQLSLLSVAHADALSNTPLFLGDTVKPNIVLTIDDSGSMDFETSASTNDGGFWYNTTTNSFVDTNGIPNDKTTSLKYVYLFPNGTSSSYNGRRLSSSGHGAIAPVRAYAFARSSEWNRAYYDPNVEYRPWPTWTTTTWSFGDVNPTAAPYDPIFNTSFTLDLTQSIYSNDSGWTFNISDTDMICSDTGTRCSSTNAVAIEYFPATYWVKKTSGTYTYQSSAVSTSSTTEIPVTGNIIIEAENGTPENSLDFNTITSGSLADSASQNSWIDAQQTSYDFPLNDGGYVYNFNATGRVYIWFRFYMPSGSDDSVHVNLQNYTSTSIFPDDGNQWATPNGEYWYRWRDGHSQSSNWQWERWAAADLTGTSQILKLRSREDGTGIDQILITSDASLTPSGTISYTSPPNDDAGLITRDCSTDIDPQYYRDFLENHSAFDGIDAIGPDGSCLERVEIKPTRTDYPSGRSYTQELQNFANWFTYYRRRHQAMRGGLAAAFQGLNGLRVGLTWFNNNRTVNMLDLDTQQQQFLDDHFQHVRSGGTPLRSAFASASEDLKRTNNNPPIIASCQKNFHLLFTDGFAQNQTVSGISNEDGSQGSPYADDYSSTAADIAMKYYTDNLRPDLSSGNLTTDPRCDQSNTPASVDCNSNLHMNTFTVGLGVQGTIFGKTHFSVEDAYINPPTWPNVNSSRDATQIDDLYHAAVNGRGDIFNASTPEKLSSTLSDAIRTIVERVGNASGVTFNTSSLSTSSIILTAKFNSAAWNGQLQAIKLDGSTGEIGNTEWEASEILDTATPNDRVIITNDGIDGLPFRWDSVSSVNFITSDLNTSPTGTNDGLAEQRLAFLRGDTTNDGTIFRDRASTLGDIVHSSPLFVAAPEQNWPDAPPFGDGLIENRYSTFKAQKAARDPVVYIGSNDGMLHGFSGEEDQALGGGKELLAYIPRSVYSSSTTQGLHYLTNPDYKHRYYVDLTPIASDVFIKPSPTASRQWTTMLLGGLRNGGRGLFALDVSDPSLFTEANASDLVLWEFDETDDPDIGDIVSEPTITMMNNGQWAVVFGNGYNSSSGRLFILFIEAGVDGTWSTGDYIEIDTGVAGGLSQPAVADLNGDKIADRIYAGDINGNLWAFDVSSVNSLQWDIAHQNTNGTPVPLFTAYDPINQLPQPITASPVLAINPNVNTTNATAPNVLVYFGTGKYLSDNDPSDTQKQSFYVVADLGQSELQRTNLQQLNVIETLINDTLYRDVTGTVTNWNTQQGFYFDLPTTAERIVLSPKLRGDTVFFNTTIPETDACAYGGSGWLMSVSLENGLTPREPAFDTNNDDKVDEEDTPRAGELLTVGIPSESGFLGDNQYTPTSAGTLERRAIQTLGGERTGRLAWDEIISND
ncbi:MAG: PilC/PilY family type IV pilus protein [Pseudomonadota bacterium]